MRSLLKAISVLVDLLSLAGCSLIAYAGVTAFLVATGVLIPGQPMFGGHLVPELNGCAFQLLLGAALLKLTQIAQRRIKHAVTGT